MCLKSGAVCLRPPIVRDESSRVFLGGALQQSPPLRRPSAMVGQFSGEVNRKDEPGLCRGRLLLSSKPVKMRAFYSGTDIATWCVAHTPFRACCRRAPPSCFRATTPPQLRGLSLLTSVGLAPTGRCVLDWTRQFSIA